MRIYCRLSISVLSFALLAAALSAQQPAYLNTNLSPQERAHDLVGRMTLDEKAAQLEDWATAIPRLGIPDYQTWNEVSPRRSARRIRNRVSASHRHGRNVGSQNGAQHGQRHFL